MDVHSASHWEKWALEYITGGRLHIICCYGYKKRGGEGESARYREQDGKERQRESQKRNNNVSLN